MDTTPPSLVDRRSPESCHDAYCAVEVATAPTSSGRAEVVRRAFQLEYATLAWMVVEAAVAIWSGVQAGSVSLVAFGIDSLIELASAGVLIWRLTIELRHGQAFAESAERMASRLAGALLFALTAYVVAAAAWKLSTRTGGAFSWPGLIVTILAMPVMYFLARQKIAIAEALGSHAMRADAMESVTCGWLSLVVMIGLVAEGLTGAWWVDAVTSLGIVWFLVKEGREAWIGDACCCD
jgi:divalent metal cation (Fe/Co/Zn/Cd) transporter